MHPRGVRDCAGNPCSALGTSVIILLGSNHLLLRRVAPRLGFALVLIVAGGCGNPHSGNPPQVLSGISLTNQAGSTLGAAELSGNVVLLNLMFTSCPSVCPAQTRALTEVRAQLPEAVRERTRFVSVSVDPANDDIPALKRFAVAYGADQPGWHFVRTNAASTELLGARLAAFAPNTAPKPAEHGTALYLFDRGGRLVQRYRGAPIEVSHLAREISALDELKPSGARLASN